MVVKRVLLAAAFAVVLSLGVLGQAAGQDFYKGKTVRIVVGYSPEGALTPSLASLANI